MIKNIVRKIVVLAASLAAGAAYFVSYGFAAGSGNPNNHISFINLSVNDGLSQCTVLSCAQDTLGRMWFATQDGLNLMTDTNSVLSGMMPGTALLWPTT